MNGVLLPAILAGDLYGEIFVTFFKFSIPLKLNISCGLQNYWSEVQSTAFAAIEKRFHFFLLYGQGRVVSLSACYHLFSSAGLFASLDFFALPYYTRGL